MKLELCVSSNKGIELASRYKFDRIELCQNLEIGGTTPSVGLVEKAVKQGLETHVLMRPRIGGFVYDEFEFECILSDIKAHKKLGVHGFVVGFFDENKDLEIDRLKQIVEAAGGLELTFHRAFDDLSDWKESLDQLFHLGFKRILTTGLSSTIDGGLHNLSFIKDACRGKIELMVGGGINDRNVGRVVTEIGPDAIHFSGSTIFIDSVPSQFNVPRLNIDEEKVVSILNIIKRA
jgi:copper homeostasis protein